MTDQQAAVAKDFFARVRALGLEKGTLIDVIARLEVVTKQRDDLLAALERIASGEAENGSILSGGECHSIAYEAIASVKNLS